MAGNQTDNLMLVDLTTGLPRTPETGGTPDTLQLSVDMELISGASMVIDGDLTVNGTTTTIHSEVVNIRDNHLYLNADYTTTVGQTGGIVINVLPTATADTVVGPFVAGVASTSNPTVITSGSGTFTAGDIIQIAGANTQTNDGIFEVLSHVGTTLTIRGVGVTGTTQSWFQNDFAADVVGGGDIRVVNVSVLQGTPSGTWQIFTGSSSTGLTYTALTAQGVVDLQEAYIQGNTITTSAPEGDVTITGTETLIVGTSGGLDLNAPFDFDSTSFDVQMTGTNGFSIDGTAASNVSVTNGNLTLSTLTSGDIDLLAAGQLDVDAGTSMVFNTANASDASGNDITFTAGTSSGGTNAGASIILTPGDGATTGIAGSVDVTGPNDEDEAIFTLETTGTSGDKIEMYVGDSDPSGTITALAGSLFFRDTGSGAELYLNTSTGSGTTWTQLQTAAGTTTLQQAYINGNTITTSAAEGDVTFTGTEDFVVTLSDLLVDTTASISLDADAASNFTVDGANLTLSTVTTGNVIVNSVGTLDMDAATTITMDTADAADASGNDITFTAGSSTAGGAAGASIILTPGDGNVAGSAGSVDIIGPNDEDEALVTLTTSGTGGDSVGLFVGDNDPSGTVTADAGSLFFRDTGAGAELYLNTSTGSGTTWTALSTGGAVTLQQAYIGGNTITTSAAEGNVIFTGTEDFVVTLSDMLVDTTSAISLDADAASNFTVDGANLTLSTVTSGNVNVTSVDAVVISAGNEAVAPGNIVTIDAGDGGGANDGGAISLTSGNSGAGATGNGGNVNITAGDALSTNGDGGVIALDVGANTGTGLQGFVDIGGDNNEDEFLVRLSTTGTGGDSVQFFVGDNNPNGTVTADAGSLFFRDTGTGGELYINTSTGSGTTWREVVTAGPGAADLTLQNAYVGGNTIVTSAAEGDFDVSGTEAISLDAQAASNFTVDSASLTLSTTTAGSLIASSAGLMDLDAGANLDIDVTGTFDMQATGAFSIDGSGVSNVTTDSGTLTLSTTTSGNVAVTSADAVSVTAGNEAAAIGNAVTIDAGDGGGANSGGDVSIAGGDSGAGATGDGGDVNITGGTATSTSGNGGDVTLTTGDGTGAGAAGTVSLTGPNAESEAIATLTTTGTNGDSVQFFVGDSDPNGSVTGLAGSLFMRDTGSGGELYVNESTGSGTVWRQVVTSGAGGSLTLQNAYVGGNTIVTSGAEGDFDVSGTEAISLDAGAASNFTVDGASLTLSTTTAGTIDITSADDIQVTFEPNNATAMVVDDGTNNFLTFDSTTGDLAIEANQFLDLTSAGAGVTLTAGATIAVGDVVALNSSGLVILADSNTGTDEDAYAIGVAATAATAANPVKVFTSSGDLVPVNFASAPGATTNGQIVFVSAIGGEGTITAPTGGGNVLYKVGILQGADGADTTPLVLLQPQFLAKRP
jgi:hypothetical protein